MAEQLRDPFIEQIAAELRRPVRLDPRFDDRVMAALEAPDVIPLHPDRQTRRPWIARPWTIRVSPIAAMAVAAAFVGAVAIGAWQLRPIDQVQMASQPAEPGVLIPVATTDGEPIVVQQFTFHRKGVKSIALVGEFNDWDETATPMTEVSEGVWEVSLPLRAGTYEFQYLVDGRRETDPTLPERPSDFGSPNSVITVSPRVR
ncbi:MAG: isoamylase early set domain-containing protein [Gemmatimonadaceae bacterium]|nr:isoamylase early set domain-containing protein [Gemmatimonadaceae bacterium]